MPFSILFVALIPAIAAFVSGSLAIYAWQRREVIGARAFALCAASIFVWCFFSVFEYLSTNEAARIVFGKAQYFGISFFPLAWFVFTSRYAQCDGWLNRKLMAVLSFIPTVSLLLALSDRWHGWIWQAATLQLMPYPHLEIVHGWWFDYVMIPQCYVLLLSGVGLLLSALFSGSRLYRRQTMILLMAALLPFVCNVLYVVAGVTFYGLDLTPVGFAIAGLLVQVGLFRTQFLEISPISYRTVFLNTADAVILLDARRRIVDLNPSAYKERSTHGALFPETGLPEKDLSEKSPVGCSFEQTFPLYRELAYHAIFWEPGHRELTKTVQLSNSSPLPSLPQVAYREVKVRSLESPGKRRVGWVIIIRDVTLEKQQQGRLEQLAYIDSLTGLFNRRQLEQTAKEVLPKPSAQISATQISAAPSSASPPLMEPMGSAALLYIDLNHFKPINDDYGHEVGDVVLKHFAHCLKRSVRQGDMVVRLGGDEFAALLYQADRKVATEVRDRLQKILTNTVRLAGHNFTLSASVGIAYYPRDGHSLKALLRCADQKMYKEKRLFKDA